MTIREYLKNYKIITDGSFGTYYAEKYQTQEIPERANLEHPERVEEIHRSYIEAGAKLIRTNTFATNTVLLNDGMDAVKENIRSAVSIAKSVVENSGKEIYIAGDIGPIPASSHMTSEQIEEQYYEIAETFAAQGVRILTFETFPDMQRILPAIRRIKQKDMFLMVQFCVNQFGYSSSGLSAKKLVLEAAAVEEIDAIGLNCGIGPGHMAQILQQIDLNHGKYTIALPNAGYPKLIRNRMRFANNQSYFVMKENEIARSGIDIVGGCCGTNPDYIRQLSESIDITDKHKVHKYMESIRSEGEPRKNGFFRHVDGSLKEKKLIAVELAPPLNADDEKILEAAHMLKQAGVDVLTFPDSPSGRTRVDSVLMAEKVRRETGMNVMPHICCRDKNAIAMRSLFMGAHINGIQNMLIITGDPIPSLVRQTVKGVFNFDSVGLMKIIKEMNEETFVNDPIVYGGAINQGRRNFDIEVQRVVKKMEEGAEFFFTQPVFSKTEVERIREIKERTGARILCGIMPLVSRRNALFIKNEIAGIDVTDEIVERYPENGTKEEGEAVGVAIAKEVIADTKEFVDGYYFSFPFNRVYLLKQIMNEI